ncbi:hypothetical protein AOT41_07930 [Limosilactobacillus fermentum]|nr:hypothetical protein AOT41_07930 [Limosilactobacillus fermentum]
MKKLDFESLKHNPEYEVLQVLGTDGKVVNEDLMPDLTDDQLWDVTICTQEEVVLGHREVGTHLAGFFPGSWGEET